MKNRSAIKFYERQEGFEVQNVVQEIVDSPLYLVGYGGLSTISSCIRHTHVLIPEPQTLAAHKI